MTPEDINELVINDDVRVLNYVQDNIVLGSITYDENTGTLYNLYVDERHRGKGIATELLKTAIGRYFPKYIEAGNGYGSNIFDLIRLYKKVGFQIKEPVKMEMEYCCEEQK